jgi:hypothetical protein
MSATVIWVADLARSVAFYSALFQTEDCYLADGFASVKNDKNEVLLHLLPEQYRDAVSYTHLRAHETG